MDARLVAIAKKIRILGTLSWPSTMLDTFLDGWRNGNPMLPEPPREASHHDENLSALASLRTEIDQSDPAGRFLDDTAGSYAMAARMIDVRGTPEFLDIGRVLYGMPGDPLPGSKLTHLHAAEQLLSATASLKDAGVQLEPSYLIGSEGARDEMQAQLDAFFGVGVVRAVVDRDLGSKAAAGGSNVRIRGGTGFSHSEIAQLLEHEAYVHAATALNGRQQPVLTSMSLASPRSTLTQEGLATLAELVTRTIDIARLRRIALRIKAIAMALDGADFIQVFRFFLEEGQSEDESVRSAMRVFRGGDPRGRYVFTKDVVYVQGLVAVHTFLRKAIATHRPVLIERIGWCIDRERGARSPEPLEEAAIERLAEITRTHRGLRRAASLLEHDAFADGEACEQERRAHGRRSAVRVEARAVPTETMNRSERGECPEVRAGLRREGIPEDEVRGRRGLAREHRQQIAERETPADVRALVRAVIEQRARRRGCIAVETEGVAVLQHELERGRAAIEAHDREVTTADRVRERPRGDGVRCRAEAHVEQHEALAVLLQPLFEPRGRDVEALRLDGGADDRMHQLAREAIADRLGAAARDDDLAVEHHGAASAAGRSPSRLSLCSCRSIASSLVRANDANVPASIAARASAISAK